MLKKVIRILVPNKVRLSLNEHIRFPLIFLRCYLYDMQRFWRYSAAHKIKCAEHKLARITALYHVLEKGLSLRNSRFLFGHDKVLQLLDELQSVQHDPDMVCSRQWQSGLRVLDAYLNQNRAMQKDAEDDPFLMKLEESLVKLRVHLDDTDVYGGTMECLRQDIQSLAKGDYPQVVFSRHSVRDFSDDPVAPEIIEIGRARVCTQSVIAIRLQRFWVFMAELADLRNIFIHCF